MALGGLAPRGCHDGDRVGIVQLHLSRHCNLRCRHCYSRSGPDVREAVDPALIEPFLADAWEQGYGIASFSGGEPLMAPHFLASLAAARACGFRTMVVSNGMLIDAAMAGRLSGAIDLVAVSVDGPEAVHNRMRGSPAAFRGALRGIEALRHAGLPFGIVHTVTSGSLGNLRWLADMALQHGARLLQLHLLEPVGRAAAEMAAELPDDDLATRAALVVALLKRELAGSLTIQLDVFRRTTIRDEPAVVLADDGPVPAEGRLSALVDPLVLEADGRMVPITAGLHPRYRIGDLGRERLAACLERFRHTTYPRLRALCRRLRRELLAQPDDLPFVDWHAALGRASRAAGGRSG